MTALRLSTASVHRHVWQAVGARQHSWRALACLAACPDSERQRVAAAVTWACAAATASQAEGSSAAAGSRDVSHEGWIARRLGVSSVEARERAAVAGRDCLSSIRAGLAIQNRDGRQTNLGQRRERLLARYTHSDVIVRLAQPCSCASNLEFSPLHEPRLAILQYTKSATRLGADRHVSPSTRLRPASPPAPLCALT